MTIRSIAAIVAITGGFLCLTTQPAAAQNSSQNDALRVLVSNGMKGTMEELRPQCEKAVGRSLAIQFGSTASLKKRIEMGEAFDVTIITTEAIGDLIKQAKLTGASRMDPRLAPSCGYVMDLASWSARPGACSDSCRGRLVRDSSRLSRVPPAPATSSRGT